MNAMNIPAPSTAPSANGIPEVSSFELKSLRAANLRENIRGAVPKRQQRRAATSSLNFKYTEIFAKAGQKKHSATVASTWKNSAISKNAKSTLRKFPPQRRSSIPSGS